MRAIPKRNFLIGGIMLAIAALCFCTGAIMAKDSKRRWLSSAAASTNAVAAVFYFWKSRTS
jgi:hypothetical protein